MKINIFKMINNNILLYIKFLNQINANTDFDITKFVIHILIQILILIIYINNNIIYLLNNYQNLKINLISLNQLMNIINN